MSRRRRPHRPRPFVLSAPDQFTGAAGGLTRWRCEEGSLVGQIRWGGTRTPGGGGIKAWDASDLYWIHALPQGQEALLTAINTFAVAVPAGPLAWTETKPYPADRGASTPWSATADWPPSACRGFFASTRTIPAEASTAWPRAARDAHTCGRMPWTCGASTPPTGRGIAAETSYKRQASKVVLRIDGPLAHLCCAR